MYTYYNYTSLSLRPLHLTKLTFLLVIETFHYETIEILTKINPFDPLKERVHILELHGYWRGSPPNSGIEHQRCVTLSRAKIEALIQVWTMILVDVPV